MTFRFTEQALDDLEYWKAHDSQKLTRIKKLLTNITETPYSGLGKPETLKFDLQGYWSRRIDHEHRLVYTMAQDAVIVVSCRYHYGK
jgi:toxin YoeB